MASAMQRITEFLNASNIVFSEDEQGMVKTTLYGSDFPVELCLCNDTNKGRLDVYSKLPLIVRKEKAVDIAAAIAAINANLMAGKFVLYMNTAELFYEESILSGGVTDYDANFAGALITGAFSVIEKYNDSLFALNKGLMTLKDVLSLA